jgi:hypothetical protein
MKLLQEALTLYNYLTTLFYLTTKMPPMKNVPIILTPESVEALVASIAEELLKGHNTYKSETAALRKKIKIGMLRTLSYQELSKKQHEKVTTIA